MIENRPRVEEAVDGMVCVLGLDLIAESRPAVIAHFEIAAAMAANLLAFPMHDDAEPAPVFTP